MNRSDAADRLERLLRRDLEAAAHESGPPTEDEIDAYVSGRAGKIERELVEQRLADYPALRAEVDALIEMQRALGDDAHRHDPARADADDVREPRDRTAPATARPATARPADERTLVGAVGRAASDSPSGVRASEAEPSGWARTDAAGGRAVGEGHVGGTSRKTERGAAKESGSRVPGERAVPSRARQLGPAPMRWATAVRAAAMGALAASLVILLLWALTNRGAPPTERAAGGPTDAGASGANSGAGTTGGGGRAAAGNPAAAGAGAGNAAAGNTAGGAGGSAAGGAGGSGAGATGGGAGGAVASGAGGGAVAPLTLRDGNAEVALLSNGALRGLDALPAADRSAIARALTSGRLDVSTQVNAVTTPSGVLLSPDDASRVFRVTAPLATAVRSARPTFAWTTQAGATGYRVRIEDAGGVGAVIESPMMTATSWTPTAALPVGRVLTWQVEAQTPQGLVRAPVPPLPEARFVVLRDADRQALDRALAEARGSDLATAAALARFGVLDDADVALARLAAANPTADIIKQVQRRLAERRFPR